MAAPPESAFNALAEFEALIVRRPFSSRVDPTSSEITKLLGEEDGYRDWITQRAGIHDRCRLISAKSRPQEALVPTPTMRVVSIAFELECFEVEWLSESFSWLRKGSWRDYGSCLMTIMSMPRSLTSVRVTIILSVSLCVWRRVY